MLPLQHQPCLTAQTGADVQDGAVLTGHIYQLIKLIDFTNDLFCPKVASRKKITLKKTALQQEADDEEGTNHPPVRQDRVGHFGGSYRGHQHGDGARVLGLSVIAPTRSAMTGRLHSKVTS